MQINGSIPFHIAKAYGVPAKTPAARPDQPGAVKPGANAASTQSTSPAAGPRGVDAFRATAATRETMEIRGHEAVRAAEQAQAARGTERTDGLIAARVPGGVTFTSNAGLTGTGSDTSVARDAAAAAAEKAYAATRVAGNFQLYTRSADAMEAATGVMRGRAIDVSG